MKKRQTLSYTCFSLVCLWWPHVPGLYNVFCIFLLDVTCIYTVNKHAMLALLSISRVALMFSQSIACASLEIQIALQYNQKKNFGLHSKKPIWSLEGRNFFFPPMANTLWRQSLDLLSCFWHQNDFQIPLYSKILRQKHTEMYFYILVTKKL